MDLNDINNLDFDDLGNLPTSVHIIISLVFCVLLIFGIYWFDTQVQLEEFSKQQGKEKDLKLEFELKHKKAANLEKYQLQLKQLEETFGSMLRKLPGKTEVPGLLEDISNQGVESGLDFIIFDPLSELFHDFYVELPIRMSLAGNYHNIGDFISRVSMLDRIVTLHDFDLRFPPEKKSKKGKKKKKKKRPGRLLLEVTAKTYRYADEAEIAARKRKEKKKRGSKRR